MRPWILRFARTPDLVQATAVPAATFYDADQQITLQLGGGLLPYMGTHKPTVPDGDPLNPPPLDEGSKD
jgi:putative ATP-grasp target RiPP